MRGENIKSKKEVMLRIMYLCGCIEYDAELKIYKNANTLKKARDRLRYRKGKDGKKEKGLIASHKADNVLVDYLTPYGREVMKEEIKGGMEVTEIRYRKGEDKRRRMLESSRTVMNMHLAGIIYDPDEKELLSYGTMEDGKNILNENIWERKEKGGTFYLIGECKAYMRQEVRSSRSVGILMVKGNRKEIYLIYNMGDKNIKVYPGTEEKMKEEVIWLESRGYEKKQMHRGAARELIYGDSYEQVYVLIYNTYGIRTKEMEKRRHWMEKEKEVTGNLKIGANTYFALNGEKGIISTLLLAEPEIREKIKEIILKTFHAEKYAAGKIEDGVVVEDEGEKMKNVYIMFPLVPLKLVAVRSQSGESIVVCLESQKEMIKEYFGEESKRVELYVYEDKDIGTYIGNLRNNQQTGV